MFQNQKKNNSILGIFLFILCVFVGRCVIETVSNKMGNGVIYHKDFLYVRSKSVFVVSKCFCGLKVFLWSKSVLFLVYYYLKCFMVESVLFLLLVRG